MSRDYTVKLIDLADEGVISWESIARSALSYMSEADVEDMAICEGFVEEEEEDEDEYDGQPDELTEWMDFDPDC